MLRLPLLVLAAALVGCAAPATLDAPAPAPGAPAETSRPNISEAERDRLEGLLQARLDRERARFTPDDVAFMTGMIGHHAQALVMADLAETNARDTGVRTLAARIDNAQHDEIRTMQTWLADRGQPVPEIHIEGTMLMIHMPDGDDGGMDHGGMDHGGMDHGGMDHASMPGMLTQMQLDELADATGTAFDRLFLRYMIQHHGGAVTMVDDLFAADGAAQDGNTFKLASDIQVDQRTEIARMQRMLDALPAE